MGDRQTIVVLLSGGTIFGASIGAAWGEWGCWVGAMIGLFVVVTFLLYDRRR